MRNYKITGYLIQMKRFLYLETLQVLDDMPVICEINQSHRAITTAIEAVNEEIKSYKGFICVESLIHMLLSGFVKTTLIFCAGNYLRIS